ncbi:GDP-L-fucose synthase [Schleiferiaceae bacterium]|nr:GDP-L-fucose synthase [Schleiferiaceae bacterium]
MIKKSDKIYIAGHRGMVGSACWRALEAEGYTNLVGKTSKELDLRDQKAVEEFIRTEQPVAIIDAAAKVGGILANDTYPYEFLMDNMLIQNNLIRSAHENDIPKFIFLGSSCIYPKFAPQPLKEEYLLTDSLEPTNEWYAIAKISGVKLIEALRKEYSRDYVSLMPTNLYGPNDNFDLRSSHVLPAMIRKFHEAKLNGNAPVELWGTGSPMREFLHADDLGQAVLFALENSLEEYLYNIGTGIDLTIKELATQIQSIVGHQGEIIWDSTKPDGTPRKLMDSSKLNLKGWRSTITLSEGIKSTYSWYLESVGQP